MTCRGQPDDRIVPPAEIADLEWDLIESTYQNCVVRLSDGELT